MSQIHSVIFGNSWGNEEHRIKWLKDHDLRPIKAVHITENKGEKHYRYRIVDPKEFKRFTTEVIKDHDLSLVLGWK